MGIFSPTEEDQTQAPEQSDREAFDLTEGGGLLGFLSNPFNVPTGLAVNAFRDAEDIASGLLHVGGMAIHDVRSAATEAGSLAGGGWDEQDYLLPDLYDSVFGLGEYQDEGSAIVNDYQHRYGTETGVLGGHFTRMYENPLSFVGDALTVATAGGGAAARAAQVAKVLGGARVATASKALGSIDDLARIGQATSPAAVAAEAELAGTGAAAVRAAKVIRAIEGTSHYIWNPATQTAERVAQSWNPARRILYQNRYLQGTTRTTKWLEAKAAKLSREAEALGPGAGAARAKAAEYAQLVEDANRVGATRVLRPGFAAHRARRFVDKAVGFATGKSANITGEMERAFENAFGPVKSQVVDDDALVDGMEATDTTLTSDGIAAAGHRDPVTGEMSGYRRAEVFDEAGPATVSRGSTPWRVAGDEPTVDDLNALIDEKTVSAANEPDAFMSQRTSERWAVKLGRAIEDGSAVDLGEGAYKLTDEAGNAHYVQMGPDGGVVSVRSVGPDGKVTAETLEGFQGQGFGSQLGAAHWRDAGIDTPSKARDALSVQEFSASGNKLAKSMVRRVTGRPEPRMPAPDTEHRAAYEAAVAQAEADVRELTPKLREAFGKEAKVTAGKPKSEAATRAKAELLGGSWRDVEDISRFRIEAEDAWDPTKAQRIVDRIEQTTGGKVKKVENSINSPMPDGSRGLRVVVEMPDGHPVEFQVLTPRAAKVVDATTNLRGLMRQMTVLAQRGEDVADMALRLRKAERISQQLWEGVTDELRVARGGPAPRDMRARYNDFRVSVFKNLTDPQLGRGLDIHSVFDNAYTPLRYKHGARFNEETGLLEGGPSALELDDVMAEAGEMAPLYYPHMDPDLIPKRGEFLRKGSVGTSVAGDQNLRRRTGRLLAEARYSKDARRVWRIRAAQAARQRESIDVLFDVAAEYGRVLGPGEVPGPGEVLFAPALVKRLAKQENAILDNLADAPDGKNLKKLLDAITDSNAAEARRLLESRGDYEFVAVPNYVVKRLYAHAWSPPEMVRLAVGTPTNIWKNITLAGRPAWVVNNLFSNVLFANVLQGVSPAKVLRQLDRRYVRAMREAMGPDFLAEVESGGLYKDSASHVRRIDTDAPGGKAAELVQQHLGQSRFGQRTSKMADWMFRMNGAMEDAFRRASAMDAVEKAAARKNINGVYRRFWSSKKKMELLFEAGLDEASWRAAVDEVNHYLNDYDALNPFERGVVKPFVLPFYAFYKHAAKLLVTMPFDHPAKARLFALLQEADENRMRHDGLDPDLLPGWMTMDTIYLGQAPEGDYRFLAGGGLNPFNAVMDSPLNTLHPMWKVLYEQATGRSTFTGEAFTDPSVVPGAFGSDDQFRITASGEAVPVEGVAPGLMEHLLQQVPQYNMAKEAILGGKAYSTTTLVDALLGEGEIIDPETGEPYSPRTLAMALGSLFGYSERSYDAAAIQENVLEGKKAALENYRKRQEATAPAPTGGGGIFTAP